MLDLVGAIGTVRPKVVDLFSGCGGMSAGLAREGFEIVAGVDEWGDALDTFARNFPNAKTFRADIRELQTSEFLLALSLEASDIDVIVGGPPCQGFSKNTPASQRFITDPRNQLFREFMRFVDDIRPRVVLMENVAEIFNAFEGRVRQEIEEMFLSMGYEVAIQVHVASDFGVPQRRRRCIFFASRTSISPSMPEPTHRNPKVHDNLLPKTASAWEAISDLPRPSADWSSTEPYDRKPENDFQNWVRTGSLGITNHFSRPLASKQQARYEALQPGQGIKDLPDHLRPKSGYSGAYGRLDFTNVAPTITRWVFHPGSGRFGHPAEPRILTMREAARLQSFPDEFVFVGSVNSVAGQIGNAVPPYLMRAFANRIKACVLGAA